MPIRLALADFLAQLREPRPHALEAAAVGRVVQVMKPDEVWAAHVAAEDLRAADAGELPKRVSSVLFVLAGPTAIEDAVAAGFDSATGLMESEYGRGFADGQREVKRYAEAPTESMAWQPRTDP